jgi:hypothetical protein
VAWEVEYTDDLEEWWNKLNESEQNKIDAAVRMLEEYGPDRPYPMSIGCERLATLSYARAPYSSSREAIPRALRV